jgi:hypothetical protein
MRPPHWWRDQLAPFYPSPPSVNCTSNKHFTFQGNVVISAHFCYGSTEKSETLHLPALFHGIYKSLFNSSNANGAFCLHTITLGMEVKGKEGRKARES